MVLILHYFKLFVLKECVGQDPCGPLEACLPHLCCIKIAWFVSDGTLAEGKLTLLKKDSVHITYPKNNYPGGLKKIFKLK